jgi:hypothetical protein
MSTSGKNVHAAQIRQRGLHQIEAIAKHRQHMIAFAADIERRLLDPFILETLEKCEVAVVIAIPVKTASEA